MTINKPNNVYIGKAIDLLDNPGNGIVKNGTIESKYNSYIAGFGGSIIQCGLLATLMIYEAKKEKKELIDILFALYNSTMPVNNQIKEQDKVYYKSIRQLEGNPAELKKIRNGLVEMAVALKLAMRCFKQVDNENK